MTSCSENMVPQKACKLYAVTQRAFYINYEQQQQATTDGGSSNPYYSDLLKVDLLETEVDDARFVALFGVYLSQQPYPKPAITVLTASRLNKELISAILKKEVPERTQFDYNSKLIMVETTDDFAGRQDDLVIVSLATPGGHTVSPCNNVSAALTRARIGVYVIGDPDNDYVHPRWREFAKYMMEKSSYGDHIELKCEIHGSTCLVSKYNDFDQVVNGGCSIPCNSLLESGYSCLLPCHTMHHDLMRSDDSA